jgi:hypothetical protein
MNRNLTESDALNIAKQYGLEQEVAHCIHELFMDPCDALYEWDLLNPEDFNDSINESGAEQYIENEYTYYN